MRARLGDRVGRKISPDIQWSARFRRKTLGNSPHRRPGEADFLSGEKETAAEKRLG